MKILLLGATGRTGRHLLRQTLERGHSVHALVRDTRKVTLTNPNLILFQGSPADRSALERAMQDCQAVLSALNISRTSDWPWAKLRTPADFLSSVMKTIIDIAPKFGIRRIIVTSAWGVAETIREIPGWFRWLIEHSNVRYPYEDLERQERLLHETSLEWTVRATGLTNSRSQNEIIVSFNNNPRPRLTLGRRKLAEFMLDALDKNLYVQEIPVVSQK